jgi:DNA polymerase
MFDKALGEAQLARARVYVTNAVKHFKWKPYGKRRKHQKPLMSEVTACRPWMDAELEVIRPKILVCLGATAAQAVLGKSVLITRDRGKFVTGPSGQLTFVTIHPSSIYRHPDKQEQDHEYRQFAADLKLVRQKLTTLKAA